MSYSKETIHNYLVKANQLMSQFETMDAGEIKMTISTGNRKIGHALNVSLLPIKTCANCKECKYLCYDIKACIAYPTCFDARVRNTVLLKKDRNRFFAEIDKKCKNRRKDKFFRWHVAGDIVDYDYFERMVETANNHKDFIFGHIRKTMLLSMPTLLTTAGTGKRRSPVIFSLCFQSGAGCPWTTPTIFPFLQCGLGARTKNNFGKTIM